MGVKSAPGMRGQAANLMAGLLFGFAVGVANQLQQATLFEQLRYAAMTTVSFTGIALLLRMAARRWLGLLLALVLSATLGFGVTGLRATSFAATTLEPGFEGQDIDITSQIIAMPQFAEDGVRFRFAVLSEPLKGEPVALPPQIYLGWYSGFGLRPTKPKAGADGDPEPPEFSLKLQRQPQPLRAGERWQMTGRQKAPHGNSNPYGFGYELWLWEQGIQATGYVRTGKSDVPPKKLAKTWAERVERTRQYVREAIFKRVDNRQVAGVIAALVVGDQNAIERWWLT